MTDRSVRVEDWMSSNSVVSVPFHLSQATLLDAPSTVQVPAYDRSEIKAGIAHIGTRKFVLSHLGDFVSDVLPHDPNWGIVATSIRTSGTVSALNRQDGLYVLVECEKGIRRARVLAPVVGSLFGPHDPSAVVKLIADPQIKLITLTVTAHGYCLKDGQLDFHNPEIARELSSTMALGKHSSIYGYLARGLKERSKTGRPLVVLSLDNLEANSATLRRALLSFITETEPSLASWVEDNVNFPVTLVDRITPVVSEQFTREVHAQIGFDPGVLVKTERFRQLIVERARFQMPPWEEAGVEVVEDCSPYWRRKFVLINAGHHVVATVAQRLGCKHIHEAMCNPLIAGLLERAHREWLTILPGDQTELQDYSASIRRRFEDDAVDDTVQRVAARATAKISQRILFTVEESLRQGGSCLKVPAFVCAVWMLNLDGRDESGRAIPVDDNAVVEKLQQVRNRVGAWLESGRGGSKEVSACLFEIASVMGDQRFARMAQCDAFVNELADGLSNVHRYGVEYAIRMLMQCPHL